MFYSHSFNFGPTVITFYGGSEAILDHSAHLLLIELVTFNHVQALSNGDMSLKKVILLTYKAKPLKRLR